MKKDRDTKSKLEQVSFNSKDSDETQTIGNNNNNNNNNDDDDDNKKKEEKETKRRRMKAHNRFYHYATILISS